MILTNIESVPGKNIAEHFGLVSGSTVRAKHLGRDIMAGFKNLVGGELKGYSELMNESRKQAVERMVQQAEQLGANAVINVRFATSSVAQGAAELYVYGTAVRVELGGAAMENLIIFIVLIVIGYTAGHAAEKRHYKSIIKREQALLNTPCVTFGKSFIPEKPVASARLVTGSVVISIDYFKRVLAGLRNIFGGEVSSYESLVDRARREAILRMRESAGTASIIINCRLETASIGKSANKRKSIGSVEAFAYGTAVEYSDL